MSSKAERRPSMTLTQPDIDRSTLPQLATPLAGPGVASHKSTAYALLRMFVGLNIFMHGVARLISGPQLFIQSTVTEFSHSVLPAVLVRGFASVVSPAEAILGVLLIVGLYTRATLFAGLLLLSALTFGTCLLQNWPVASEQMVYALAYSALLAFVEWNRPSLDAWRQGRRRGL
jgi:thiosulfate dehydrogenase [quinone] large subunit